jgi:hypothetical protein
VVIDIHLDQLLALGYGSKRISRKKKGECKLRGRHSDCYWVEVRKREEKTKRSKLLDEEIEDNK